LPPQQASEASDARLPKLGARVAPSRPHLVTSEHWSPREMEIEVAGTAELADSSSIERVTARAFDLHVAGGRGLPEARRHWSARASAKRILDVGGAVLLGLVFSPLIVIVALLLRWEGGPIIYRHRRVGRDGKMFECLKFRSMVPNAERVLRDVLEEHPEMKAEWVRDHKLRCDPRVTSLGRFLRRTSLDELPQLWNVLRGEMSLVGPRPIVREELMRYGRCLPVYLSAKPGITGLWQVTGRNNTDYRRRVALDVYYVRKQGLLLDLYILLKTPRVVLGGGGAY
jgi:exopolysaccharide production protein ExoY